jgi:hypothetical protein
LKGVFILIHNIWENKEANKIVKCVHTDASKYIVNRVLTAGQEYEVKNETEEFYFIIDNTGKVGGFYKDYFQEL